MGEEPKPPDPREADLKPILLKILEDQSDEFEKTINYIVEKKLDERVKPLEDMLKNKEERIHFLEKEIKELRNKKLSFSNVAQKSLIFENNTASLAPPAPTASRTPSPASRPGYGTTTTTERPPVTRSRRPSTTTITDVITEEEVRRSFKDCKRKIQISPITLEHIRVMYVGLTNDMDIHPDYVIADGESHEEARKEAAADYFRDELNMEDHQFSIHAVQYKRNWSEATMIVTMTDEKYVTKALRRKAEVRNDTLKVNNCWPHFSFQRRRALFDLIKAARDRHPGTNFQVRLGATDFEIHEKPSGGHYHQIPMNFFLSLVEADPDSVPGFYKLQEKSRGRGNRKRGPSTPEHSDQSVSQRPREDQDESILGEDSSTDNTGDTEGESGSASNGRESLTTGERNNSKVNKDEATQIISNPASSSD